MTITNTSIQRSIVLTEYIPVQVRAETACNTIDYCSFRKDDTSLLELAFDQLAAIVRAEKQNSVRYFPEIEEE